MSSNRYAKICDYNHKFVEKEWPTYNGEDGHAYYLAMRDRGMSNLRMEDGFASLFDETEYEHAVFRQINLERPEILL